MRDEMETNDPRSSWLAMHNLSGGQYENIPGLRYRFPPAIPNGKTGMQVGDTVICVRAQSDTPKGEGRIFGIGRIGKRLSLPDGRAEVYYDRYLPIDPPINWSDLGGDPRNNTTNSIVSAPDTFVKELLVMVGLGSMDDAPEPQPSKAASREQYAEILSRAGALPPVDSSHKALGAIADLTVESVETAAVNTGLSFDGTDVVAQSVAALLSGKHLILQGAPGTGKTSLAELIAEVAESACIHRGAIQITGSSDWTPSDTVGTYRLNREKDLEFVHGYLLRSIAEERWVVLDELNRADIDRALGPFFTVLSGNPTSLRFEEETDEGGYRKVAVVPEGRTVEDHVNYTISPNWRIIATMNTKDLDLLFEVSQAFLRRFAVITVPCPEREAHKKLLGTFATGQASVDEMVERLTSLPGLELGPAITLDCARYVRTRYERSPGILATDLGGEIFSIFIAPQLVSLDEAGRVQVERYLRGTGTALSSGDLDDASEDDDIETENLN